jgi:ABC-2 type transport system ATP-binding protein
MSEVSHAVASDRLTKRFGRKTALDSVSLHVPVGSVYGLIGPNGAGKTTFIRCLLSLLNPTRGRVTVLGHDLARDSVAARRRLGHVAALQPIWESMRVRELARFMSGCYPRWNRNLVSALLTRTRIDPDARLGTLSRGQRTLAVLAAQMGHEPDLLILDEALTGLDPAARREVLRGVIELMQSEGRTVLIAGQDLADMERICDHAGILVDGRLVVEAPASDLKLRMRRFHVSHAPDVQVALPERAVSVRRQLRETSFVVDGSGDSVLAELRAKGLEAEENLLSLEEILLSVSESAPVEAG